MSAHELAWDNTLLTGSPLDGPYWFETLAENASFGDPQPVEVGLTSLLLDGTRKRTTRHDNRTPSFLVEINGATAADLADGEKVLWLLAQTPDTSLVWTPPDSFGSPTAFDVETAHLEYQFDDINEIGLRRVYRLTWECQPFARSTFATELVLASGVDVVVDDGTSTAGWSTSYGTLAVVSGAVVNTRDRDNWATLTRAGAIDLTDTPYLTVEWSSSVSVYIGLRNAADAANWSEAYRESVGANYRSYFYVGESVGASGFALGVVQGLTSGSMTFSVHEVSAVATLPNADTAGHQQTLAIPAGGSARTHAEIAVSTAANGLGEVVLYTCPSSQAYNPSARQWLNSSATPVSDPAGDYYPITTAGGGANVGADYAIPSVVLPKGGYAIAALLRSSAPSTALTIFWQVQTRIDNVVRSNQLYTTVLEFPDTEWRTHILGLETLPQIPVGPAGEIHLTIYLDPGAAEDVWVYDLMFFHEDGDLTITDAETGAGLPSGPSRRIRVVPPSATAPGGSIERGHEADWSDAWANTVRVRPSRGGHVIHPEGTTLWLYTEGTPDGTPATVDVSWFKRWHTHAGD